MNKFLFTDGVQEVKEAHSKEELLSLINASADPAKARIWLFNSSEWIAYPAFLKKYPDFHKTSSGKSNSHSETLVIPKKEGRAWIRKTLFITAALTGALLLFNYTSVKWEKATPLKTTAARPENVPFMDIDSLVSEIELMRGKLIDKGTRYNLRLRNNWPEYILLHLDAEKETKGSLSSFFNVAVSVDNATGFNIDHAQIKLQVWKNGKPDRVDTIQFNGIGYNKPATRHLSSSIRGDSLTVSFQSIRAGAFNFCYSSAVKNNSGNYNDRWFCRDGKIAE